jgi:hypothetical protein
VGVTRYWWGEREPVVQCPSCSGWNGHKPRCRLWMLWTTSGVRPQDEYGYLWGTPPRPWEPRERAVPS